ncbi:MAG: helicase [Firmicutes bacterium]|nr:helicase [Bacillota bacterium]
MNNMMMTTITNTGGNTLSKKLKQTLPKSDRIDALVGYFYFSGFKDLHNELKDKTIRILVGMDIEKKIIDRISAIDSFDLDSHATFISKSSRSRVKEDYIENFSKIFNETDYFDNEESQGAFEIFLSKIKDGSLEIKKTAEANHSKYYIIHNSSSQESKSGMVIVGSSNLTVSGLKGQKEHNIVLEEQHYYDDHVNKFEEEWNNPENITISDLDSAEDFIKEVKDRIWLYSLPDPLMMYYRVLNEYFSIDVVEDVKSPHEITGGKYFNLKYQKDAIDLGIDRINRFGGVIIADVVGLGKSIIASAIAHNLGRKTIIIAPPHLESQWTDYLSEFDIKGFVYTTGKIHTALERHGNDKDLLIVLDEAHKHRNEDTDSYKLLHRLCAGNEVMALSATPFNNDPKDIYALIKLFSTPGRSTIKTVENLSVSFHGLFARYKKMRKVIRSTDLSGSSEIANELQAIATELRKMIEPLVIRRSRLDLEEIQNYKEDLKRQGVAFAKVEDPELLEYDLGDLYELYSDTLNKISSKDSDDTFEGVRYKPAKYLKLSSTFVQELLDDEDDTDSSTDKVQSITQAQVNVAKFMRRLLVRRFESSIGSFNASLNNMITSSELMLDWYDNRKVVPIYKKGSLPDTETLSEMNDDEVDILFEKLEDKGLIQIPISEIKSTFRGDLEKDIDILKNIQVEWSKVKIDPKYEFFKSRVLESLKVEKNRKLIVFTEFSDTANYIYDKLQSDGVKRVYKYTSADASTINKETIRKNFDAGLSIEKQLDDYDIIIATDAISEGFNLHRAGTVINYDIPYNPTRVVQRVGRINRINKKVFDILYIYNFFPTATGEEETRTRAISTLKMDLIHSLLGEDTKIFTKDEELKNYFAKKYNEENNKNESLSWDAPYRNTWLQIKDDQEIMQKISEIPHRARISRKSSVSGVVAFAKRNGSFVFAYGKSPDTVEVVSPEVALPLFDDVIDAEESSETTVNFEPIYKMAKAHIFKDNTKPPIKGRRKQDALAKVEILSERYPASKDLCLDVVKIIKDLDGLPNGVLKEIGELKISDDLSLTFRALKEIVPRNYIDDIFETADRASDTGKLIVLSEELIS